MAGSVSGRCNELLGLWQRALDHYKTKQHSCYNYLDILRVIEAEGFGSLRMNESQYLSSKALPQCIEGLDRDAEKLREVQALLMHQFPEAKWPHLTANRHISYKPPTEEAVKIDNLRDAMVFLDDYLR